MRNSDYCLPTEETIRQINAEVHLSPSGKLLSARSRHKYVMEILADHGYLEPWHLDAAQIFMALRSAWLSPVAHVTSKLSDEVLPMVESTGRSMPVLYDHLRHQLERRQIAIVEWGATTIPRNCNSVKNAIIGKVCHDAFSAMMNAIDTIYQDMRNNALD